MKTNERARPTVVSAAPTESSAISRAHALFDPIAATMDLIIESDMAAAAVSGYAPAYLYAFIETSETAGVKARL
jgi:pyrroline-5-carboxylate reductase